MNTENTRADPAALAAIIRGALSTPTHAAQIRAVIEATIAQHTSARAAWRETRGQSENRRDAAPEPSDPLEPFGDGSGLSNDFAQWRRATPEPTRRAVISCLLAGWHDAEDGQSGVLLTRLFPGGGDLKSAVGDRVLRQRFHERGRVVTLARVASLIDELGWGNRSYAQPESVDGVALPVAVALTADHDSILAVMRLKPTRCMTVIAVAGKGEIRNRETVGRLLRELAEAGMVERRYGKRKGYALTDAGRKRVSVTTPT